MKSRIFQAILILIVFALGVILFANLRTPDSESSSSSDSSLEPTP